MICLKKFKMEKVKMERYEQIEAMEIDVESILKNFDEMTQKVQNEIHDAEKRNRRSLEYAAKFVANV